MSERLSLKTQYAAMTERLACHDTSIVDEKFHREIICSIDYEVILPYNIQSIVCHEQVLHGVHLHVRVDGEHLLLCRQHLGYAYIFCKMDYLTLQVAEVNHIYELSQRQFDNTAGAMLTIDLEDKASAISLINRLKVIHRASNLFDNKSLALHPASTIFAALSGSQRRAMDVYDTTIRLSIGLEHVDDLYEDILNSIHS